MNALNSLFGNNTATNAPDFSGDFATAYCNLLRDGTGSNVVHGVDGNLVGTPGSPIDPLLGPLQDNGGSTLTHALLPSSPAIDAGTADGAPATDQRGVPRDANPDIGAFEFVPEFGPAPPERPGALQGTELVASVNRPPLVTTWVPAPRGSPRLAASVRDTASRMRPGSPEVHDPAQGTLARGASPAFAGEGLVRALLDGLFARELLV